MKPTIEEAIQSASFAPSERLHERAAALRASRKPKTPALRWMVAALALGAMSFAAWQRYPRITTAGEWVRVPTAKINTVQPFKVAIPSDLLGGYRPGLESTIDVGSSAIRIDEKVWSADHRELLVSGHFRGVRRDATELRTTIVQSQPDGSAPRTVAWVVVDIRAPFTCFDSVAFDTPSKTIEVSYDESFSKTKIVIAQASKSVTASLGSATTTVLQVTKAPDDYGFVVLKDIETGYERVVRLTPVAKVGRSVQECFGFNFMTPTNGKSQIRLDDVPTPSSNPRDWKVAADPSLCDFNVDRIENQTVHITALRRADLNPLQPFILTMYCKGRRVYQTIIVHESNFTIADEPKPAGPGARSPEPPRLPR